MIHNYISNAEYWGVSETPRGIALQIASEHDETRIFLTTDQALTLATSLIGHARTRATQSERDSVRIEWLERNNPCGHVLHRWEHGKSTLREAIDEGRAPRD